MPSLIQTHSLEEGLREHQRQLLEGVREREEMLDRLQQETAFLTKQHADAQHEVHHLAIMYI